MEYAQVQNLQRQVLGEDVGKRIFLKESGGKGQVFDSTYAEGTTNLD
jgi:hypothetical protein